MELGSLLTEDTNLVEFYICPNVVRNEHEIVVGYSTPLQLGSRFGNGTQQELKEYHHRDMTYVYDLDNDAQRVVRKLPQKQCMIGNMYGVSYVEEILSSHRFPCTKDIAHSTKIIRTTYRINNRLFLVHDKDEMFNYYYLRYQHSGNVDVLKMQQDLERTVACLKKMQLVRTS